MLASVSREYQKRFQGIFVSAMAVFLICAPKLCSIERHKPTTRFTEYSPIVPAGRLYLK